MSLWNGSQAAREHLGYVAKHHDSRRRTSRRRSSSSSSSSSSNNRSSTNETVPRTPLAQTDDNFTVGGNEPAEYMCATEPRTLGGGCPECTMSTACQCNGYVTFGYGNTWTPWYAVSGIVECSITEFGDPIPGHDKVCICSKRPREPVEDGWNMTEGSMEVEGAIEAVLGVGFWSGKTYAGLWWPMGIVVVPAFILVVLLTLARWTSSVNGPGVMELTLEAAVPALLYFAPMECSIFVAVAKRTEQVYISQAIDSNMTFTGFFAITDVGVGSAHGSPDLSEWVRLDYAMKVCAIAFFCQVVFRVLYEWLSVRRILMIQYAAATRLMAGGISEPRTVGLWMALYQVSVAATYGALSTTLTLLVMQTPGPPFDTATKCTIVLAVLYFMCYFALHTVTFSEQGAFSVAIMKLACLNMNFAPMLSTLFLGMQVAADNSDLPVPDHVQQWMRICSGMVIFQAALSVAMPCLFDFMLQGGDGDIMMKKDVKLILFSLVRWAAMAVLYAGVGIICRALFIMDAMPPRAHVLCALTAGYFCVYILLWMTMTLKQLCEGDYAKTLRVLSVLKELVALCPLAATLHLGLWIVTP